MRHPIVIALVAAALAAAGCETPAPRPPTSPAPAPQASPPRPSTRPAPAAPVDVPRPVVPVKSAAEVAVDEGATLYDAGSYNEAIKMLTGAREIWDSGTDALKVRAYKYVAFSHCVLGRRTLCRAQFTEALKLDPNFTLEPAERTHPIWGVEYEAAKKALAASQRPGAATPTKPATTTPVRPPTSVAPTAPKPGS